MKTEKRCSRCGETKSIDEFGKNKHQWDGLQTYCKPCNAAIKRDSVRHKEYNRDYMVEYRKKQAANRLIIKEQKRVKRDQENEGKRIEKAAERRRKSEEKQAVRKEKQKIRFAEFLRTFEFTEERREKYNLSNRLRMKVRRAKQRTNGGKITKKDWKIICDHFWNKCLCCGKKELKYKDLTMDHIVPVIKGGTSNWTNLQPLCFSCNARKHADIIDFRPPYLIPELEAKLDHKKARGCTVGEIKHQQGSRF